MGAPNVPQERYLTHLSTPEYLYCLSPSSCLRVSFTILSSGDAELYNCYVRRRSSEDVFSFFASPTS